MFFLPSLEIPPSPILPRRHVMVRIPRREAATLTGGRIAIFVVAYSQQNRYS
jgi:hypothetical protein